MILNLMRPRQAASAPEEIKPVSFAEFFGNDHAVEVEIGCGKGKFLLGRAVESPDRNFLGIDIASKWMRVGEERGQKRSLQNLIFIKAEIRQFIKAFPPASVSVFHVYFPDPWPKRRHRPRRTLTADFLKTLHAYLLPSGLLEIATDDADYYSGIQKAADATGEFWKNRREAVNERLMAPHLKTNYELKFEAEGRNLYYMELKK